MNDVAVITLSMGHGFAIVDKEDFERLNRRTWSKIWSGYVVASTTVNYKRKHFLMHREILRAPRGLDVDHINGCRFDNRRCNLRLCTRSQNLCHFTRLNRRNTSGINGVSWAKNMQKWNVKIRVDGRQLDVGHYSDLQKAARVRRAAARIFHGQFASIV